MKKKLLFIYFFLILTLFISAEDNSNDDKLIGKKVKNLSEWTLSLQNRNNKINIVFYKEGAIYLPVNEYQISIDINNNKYQGTIVHKNPFFGADKYELKINGIDFIFEGKITKSYKKVFRKDNFFCKYNNIPFEGFIEYKRNGDKIFNFKCNNIITGTSSFKNNKKVKMLNLNSGSISSEIKINVGNDFYKVQNLASNESDLVLYFILEIYEIIDTDVNN